MTREELENWREKVRNGTVLTVKISAANELIVAINRLRLSKDIDGSLTAAIKKLILQHTAEDFDEIYWSGGRFSAEILKEINIDAIANEALRQILELVKARKAELEKEFADYKI